MLRDFCVFWLRLVGNIVIFKGRLDLIFDDNIGIFFVLLGIRRLLICLKLFIVFSFYLL